MSVALRRIASWSSVIAWASIIFYMSSIPGSKIPGLIPAEVAHFLEYLVLGVLLYLALRTDMRPSTALALALVLASAYGVTDEFHQRFVVLRTPDVRDWVTDTLGALAGTVIAQVALGVRYVKSDV